MPTFLLSIYLAFVILQPQLWLFPPYMLPPNLLDMITGVVLFVNLIGMLRGNLALPARLPHLWLMIGFYCAAILSDVVQTAFASMWITIQEVGKLLVTFILILMVCNSTDRIQIVVRVILATTVIISVHCILQIYLGRGLDGQPPLLMQGYYRAQFVGVLSDPNDTSFFLIITMPLVFCLKIRSTALRITVYTLLLLLMFWAAQLTQSRGGYIALVAMATFACSQFMKRRKFIFAMFFIIALSFTMVPSRLADSGVADQDRSILWGAGMQVFKSNPVTGIGPRRIEEYIGKAPHNTFVHAFSETGLIGYFFFFSLMLISAFGCWQVKRLEPDNEDDVQVIRQARAMLASLVGFAASSYFLSRLYFMPYYILLGLAAAIYIQAGKSVSLKSLNHVCFVRLKTAWYYPVATVGSIVGIYISILVVNRLQ